MASKPPTPPAPRQNKDAFEVPYTGESPSQALARIVTDGTASAATFKVYADCGESLEVPDLVKEMKRAGDEAVSGNMARTERMLANQLLTLDAMFHNLARRAYRQEQFKGIEVLTRLALKAQSQARATAETLGMLKNPMPYIKQANIAHGPQQVNNGTRPTHADNFQTEQNKLLEAQHGNPLDPGAATATGRGNQEMAALGAVNRPTKRRGQATIQP